MATLSMTASTIAARLASGDLKAATVAEILTLLNVVDGATKSEFEVGTFTRDTALASGTQDVATAFDPTAVFIVFGETTGPHRCVGYTDGTINWCMGTGGSNIGEAALVVNDQGGGNRYVGSIDTAAGTLGTLKFTIDWVKTSSPSGTKTFSFLALK